jgi:hypothetical protein
MTDLQNDETIDISTMFFPIEHGKIAASKKLAPVLTHYFDDAPVWTQGIVAADAKVDHAHKEYLAIKDFNILIELMKWNQANDTTIDSHLYELLRDDCPVRPYFDLEWDAEQHSETDILGIIIPIITECLYSIGFRTCRGLSVYTASGACSSHVISSGKKASFHVLFDTVELFENVAHHQQFVRGVLLPHINKHANEYSELWWNNASNVRQLVLDANPYNGRQTFRLPHHSKWVSGAARPLVLYDITALGYPYSEVYTAGVYEDPATLSCIKLAVKPNREPVRAIAAGVETAEYAKIAELCGCLSASFLGSYESTRNLIWMLWASEQTPRMRGLIHQVCQRGHNYCYKWVEGLIKGFKFSGFTVGSLVTWAREGAGMQTVEDILGKYKTIYYEELFQRTMKPAQHRVIHERYLGEDISFGDNDTILIHSHLGTGKTVTITNYIRMHNIERLLIISPRKSYTQSQLGIFNTDFGLLHTLESYMDHSGPLSHLPSVIVQVESLHRVGEWFEPYDLVIMDESESILNQLHSTMTHGDNLINNHQVLELAVRTAKKVILADAFMTDRTFHFVRSLRRPDKTMLLENTYQPYSREAILLHKKDSAEVNTDAFFERIMAALRAGRRIVVVWTSKRVGEEFEERFLKKEEFTYLFYHSDSSKEDIQGLRDVASNWAKVACLMMTTSITVGISYDPVVDAVCEETFNVWDAFRESPSNMICDGTVPVADARFDEAFLYGTSTTALPRDIAQSLLRVRVLKANRLTYVIDAPVYAVEECGFTNVCNLLAAKEERLIKDHPLVKWTLCPKWARWNHTYNENERRCSCTHYKAVLQKYLENSGYELKTDVHDVSIVAEEIEVHPLGLEWGDISDIEYEGAKKIQYAIQRGDANNLDKMSYQKFVFRAQLVDTLEEEVLGGFWEKFVMKREIEKFWNVVTEKRMSMEDMVRREARYRFAPMAAHRIKQREALREFLGIMGLAHSQQVVVLSHEVLVEVGPALCAAEERLRVGMGLRATRRKGEWKTGNTIDLIRVMLEEWGGGTVRSVATIVKRNKKILKDFTLYLNENNILWDSIRDYNRKMDDFLINI